MFSVLVPVFNVDVRVLIKSLVNSCTKSGKEFQIIVLDDFSRQEFRDKNREVSEFFHVSYIELSENYGRAKVRNKLASLASQPWLLFLDCDSILPDEDNFIFDYVHALNGWNKIIYGGRIYSTIQPNKEYNVHYHYGKKTESKKASVRKKNPVRNFHSNNFLIASKAFQSIKFNEDIEGYGYEDVAFAHLAFKSGLNITHIDNPVIHNQLDPNETYILKTKNALKNLYSLYEKNLLPATTLISTSQKLKSLLQLLPFKRDIESLLEKQLISGNYHTLYFQFWKLLQFYRISEDV